MKRALMIGLVLTLLLTTLGTVAMAAGRHPGSKKDESRKGNFISKLNLTPEQEQKLLEIRQRHAREILPLRQELQKKRLELNRLWEAEKPNATAIERKMIEMVPLQVKMRMKAMTMRDEIRAILTPEQQEQFDAFQNERGHRRRGFHSKGKGPKC